MKKGILIVIVLLLVTVTVFWITQNSKKYDEIIVIKPNTVGNNTNNISRGLTITIQDDWIYYSFEPGLYKAKIDGTKITKLADSDYITSINVVGEWIYYVEQTDIHRHDDEYDGHIYYNNLYKIKINGSSKTLVLKNAYKVNIRNNKLFYITGYGVMGREPESSKEKNIHALVTSNLDGSEKEVIVPSGIEGVVMNDDIIYYSRDGKLFIHDMKNTTDEFLLDNISTSLLLYNNDAVFFNRKTKSIEIFNLSTRKTGILLDDVEYCGRLYIYGDKLHYTDNRSRLFEYDLNTKIKRQIKYEGNNVLFYDDKIYEVFRDNTIKILNP